MDLFQFAIVDALRDNGRRYTRRTAAKAITDYISSLEGLDLLAGMLRLAGFNEKDLHTDAPPPCGLTYGFHVNLVDGRIMGLYFERNNTWRSFQASVLSGGE